jgi:hypothetical protein
MFKIFALRYKRVWIIKCHGDGGAAYRATADSTPYQCIGPRHSGNSGCSIDAGYRRRADQ